MFKLQCLNILNNSSTSISTTFDECKLYVTYIMSSTYVTICKITWIFCGSVYLTNWTVRLLIELIVCGFSLNIFGFLTSAIEVFFWHITEVLFCSVTAKLICWWKAYHIFVWFLFNTHCVRSCTNTFALFNFWFSFIEIVENWDYFI